MSNAALSQNMGYSVSTISNQGSIVNNDFCGFDTSKDFYMPKTLQSPALYDPSFDLFLSYYSPKVATKGIGGLGKHLSSIFKSRFLSNTVPANRLNHIFGKSEHALEGLVLEFGSQSKAYNAVQNAANQALNKGLLTPNAKGILPSGNAGNIINVGNTNVRLIGGRVVNGKVVLSSFSRKGL